MPLPWVFRPERSGRKKTVHNVAAYASWAIRQFLLPLIRPMAKIAMMFFQVIKIFIPNRFTSSKVLHRTIYWGLRRFINCS